MKEAIDAPNGAPKECAPRCEIIRYEADRKKDLVGFQGQVRYLKSGGGVIGAHFCYIMGFTPPGEGVVKVKLYNTLLPKPLRRGHANSGIRKVRHRTVQDGDGRAPSWWQDFRPFFSVERWCVCLPSDA